MKSECMREPAETFDLSTVQVEYSMTSERAWETVEIIDQSTIREGGPSWNFRKH